MSDLDSTFADFFGPAIEEDNRIELGNRILRELEQLGYDFHEQRQITRGELVVELPEELATDLARYQEMKAKKQSDDAELEQARAEQEQEVKDEIAKAYIKKTGDKRLSNSDITLLIGFGFGEDTGHVGGETELHGFRFVEGLTPQQIAERTGTHESNWRNKAASGEVPAIKVGKQWILPAYLAGDEDYLQVIYAESQYDDQADIEENPLLK